MTKIYFKYNPESCNKLEWIKDVFLEGSNGNFYKIEIISIAKVRELVMKDSYIHLSQNRIIINYINLKNIIDTIQELECDDFFTHQTPISKPSFDKKFDWFSHSTSPEVE